MTKRIFSVLLAVCMLLAACSVSAFAEDGYKVSRIAYFSGEDEISTLTAGNITAKIKVKSETSTDALYFAAILYKNNKIIAAGADETPEAVSTSAVTYEAALTVPQDLIGAKLVTILWNNLKDMKPICTSSIVPSSDARLLSISVDDTALEGFSPDTNEYEYTLSAEQIAKTKAPFIEYTAADNGARVEITDPVKFPGEAALKVTAPDGTEKTYMVTYKSGVDPVEVTAVVPEENASLIKYQQNLQPGIAIAADRTGYLLSYVDEDLLGLDYITSAYDATTATVKFNRAAKVHAFGRYNDKATHEKAFTETDGWTLDTTGWDKSGVNNWPDDDTLPESDWTYGENNSRIGDGINEFPGKVEDNANTKYDLKTQGWMYINMRAVSGQTHRTHSECSLTHKYTKNVTAEASLTVPHDKNTQGIPIVIEWADWEANDYSELDF